MAERNTIYICTHDGIFHPDEALAVGMLKLLFLKEGKGIMFARTRNLEPEALDDPSWFLVDVGMVYDPDRNLFDHHQLGFSETFGPGFQTTMSSAGLVFKHYGYDLIYKVILPLLGARMVLTPNQIKNTDIHRLMQHVYANFIEEIDARDNGIAQYAADVRPRYRRNSTDMHARIARLNPAPGRRFTKDEENQAFENAVEIAMSELDAAVVNAVYYFDGYSAIERAFAHRSDLPYIVLRDGFVPNWKDLLFDAEEQAETVGRVKYVVYPSPDMKKWNAQAVPLSRHDMVSRTPFPAEWRGLQGDKLDECTGIKGGVFVHASGFMAAHNTEDGMVDMVIKSLLQEG